MVTNAYVVVASLAFACGVIKTNQQHPVSSSSYNRAHDHQSNNDGPSFPPFHYDHAVAAHDHQANYGEPNHLPHHFDHGAVGNNQQANFDRPDNQHAWYGDANVAEDHQANYGVPDRMHPHFDHSGVASSNQANYGEPNHLPLHFDHAGVASDHQANYGGPNHLIPHFEHADVANDQQAHHGESNYLPPHLEHPVVANNPAYQPQPAKTQFTARDTEMIERPLRLDQAMLWPPLEMNDTRVPFWNIAHMINSIAQIDEALAAGANGTMSEAYPHLIFNNMDSKLAKRLTNILKHLFPVPKADSKRIITFANNKDFISFRHHNYKKGAGITLLAEVGPRFEMMIYDIKLGTIDVADSSASEWALRHYMNTAKTALTQSCFPDRLVIACTQSGG